MKVIIIGGTGLLGFHATLDLFKNGHQVSILALPPMPAANLFPDEVNIVLKDLNSTTDAEVAAIISGMDALVFAAGADDRVTPKAPAYPFFYKHNVQPVKRLVVLCREAGVKKLIILGSYFAYFHRLWPHMDLTRHHPYIRSRVEQTQAAVEAGGAELAVITLELPYIFGTMPGRTPIWKPLIVYAASKLPLFYPSGGTTCVTVNQVAQAICGAVERGEAGACYPIGGENLTWKQLLKKITIIAGRQKEVITLPDWLVRVATILVRGMHKLQGREGGLEPIAFVKLQTANTFIDSLTTRQLLRYDAGGLDEALKKTVEVCLKK